MADMKKVQMCVIFCNCRATYAEQNPVEVVGVVQVRKILVRLLELFMNI